MDNKINIKAAHKTFGEGERAIVALQAVDLDQPGLCSGLPARLPQATDVEGW